MGRISPLAGREEEILQLRSQKILAKDIAPLLGVPYALLIAFCKRRGIRFPKTLPKTVDDERLPGMIASGLTQQQAAEALGVSLSAIERRCARLGLQTARTGPRSGAGHPDWGGGRSLDKHGYVRVWVPLHPSATQAGYVSEHRLVAEVVAGKFLDSAAVVHHDDDHPRHNWPANLVVFSSNADHLRHELTGRVKATPKSSVPGAYGNSQRIDHCPGEHETLAQCPSEIRQRLTWMIDSLRPTTEQGKSPRQSFLRSGGWRDPFGFQSMALCNGSRP